MLSKFYALIGGALLLWYLQAETRGYIFADATDARATLPSGPTGPEVHRRSTFWSAGFHGGK